MNPVKKDEPPEQNSASNEDRPTVSFAKADRAFIAKFLAKAQPVRRSPLKPLGEIEVRQGTGGESVRLILYIEPEERQILSDLLELYRDVDDRLTATDIVRAMIRRTAENPGEIAQTLSGMTKSSEKRGKARRIAASSMRKTQHDTEGE